MRKNVRRQRPSHLVHSVWLLLVFVAGCDGGKRQPLLPGEFAITSVTAECGADEAPVRVLTWGEAVGVDSYRVLLNGERLAEVGADVTSYEDTTQQAPGEALSYLVRALNAAGSRDSAPFAFTVPTDECATDPEGPGEPEDPAEPGDPADLEDPSEPVEPEDPTDPETDLPGPFDHLTIELRCTPFGEVHAEWGPVPGATSYTLMQGPNVLHEATDEATSAVAEPVRGAPFEFTLHAHNDEGTLTGPVTLPNSRACAEEQPLLAAGWYEAMFIDEDDEVWGWGRNGDHVLGMGTEPLPRPEMNPAGPSNTRKLLLGSQVGVALTREGTVQTWGTSTVGMLGHADTTILPSATDVPGLTNIVDVAVGDNHVLAADQAGRVWIWGTFLGRQIDTPEVVPLAQGILAVAAGSDTAYGLRTDGTVLAWGRNDFTDPLGVEQQEDFPEPFQVPGIDGAVELYAYERTMFFRRADGSIASLGRSHFDFSRRGVSEWPNLHGLRALSIGSEFVLALTPEDRVIGWGQNLTGVLGGPPREWGVFTPPTILESVPPMKALVAGRGFAVAVDHNSRLHVWGRNSQHELGLDAVGMVDSFTEVRVPDIASAVEIGPGFVVALGFTGDVYSWGSGTNLRLNSRAGNARWTPAKVDGLERIIQISAGSEFVLALDSSGDVYSWGTAAYGVLGDDSPPSDSYSAPVRIRGLHDIVKVSAGRRHAVALGFSGRIWTWGYGRHGALGQGDSENRHVPTLVDLPENVVVKDIAAGGDYTLFIANTNAVGGFGRNHRWQLGDEEATQQDQLSPVAIGASLAGLERVFAGNATSYVVNGLNVLHAWGDNQARIKGCCEAGVAEPTITPVPGVSDIDMVAASDAHAIFLDASRGVAHGIGSNSSGELGLPAEGPFHDPVELPLVGRVTSVSATHSNSAVVLNGKVLVTGSNEYGVLGRAPLHSIGYPVMLDVPPVAVAQAYH